MAGAVPRPIWTSELSVFPIRTPDVQPLLSHGELDLTYHPRLIQPERCPEQFLWGQARNSLTRCASGSPTSKPLAVSFFHTWPIYPLSPLETARSGAGDGDWDSFVNKIYDAMRIPFEGDVITAQALLEFASKIGNMTHQIRPEKDQQEWLDRNVMQIVASFGADRRHG